MDELYRLPRGTNRKMNMKLYQLMESAGKIDEITLAEYYINGSMSRNSENGEYSELNFEDN